MITLNFHLVKSDRPESTKVHCTKFIFRRTHGGLAMFSYTVSNYNTTTYTLRVTYPQ